MPTEAHPSQPEAWLPALLQTTDALFPTGAYAHSFGLEELVRLGIVRNEATLADCLQEHVLPSLQSQELPYLRFALEIAPRLPELCAIDRELHASKLARESREASAQIGVRRLKAFHILNHAPLLALFLDAIQRGEAHGHQAVACAIVSHCEGIPLHATLATFAYQSLAGACAAALKLIRIGQEGCQRALRHAVLQLPRVLQASLLVERSKAGVFSPVLEIASMRHAFAQERLFIS